MEEDRPNDITPDSRPEACTGRVGRAVERDRVVGSQDQLDEVADDEEDEGCGMVVADVVCGDEDCVVGMRPVWLIARGGSGEIFDGDDDEDTDDEAEEDVEEDDGGRSDEGGLNDGSTRTSGAPGRTVTDDNVEEFEESAEVACPGGERSEGVVRWGDVRLGVVSLSGLTIGRSSELVPEVDDGWNCSNKANLCSSFSCLSSL